MDDNLDYDFSIDTSKEDLEKTFTSWLKESQTYHDHLLKFQKMAEQYYIGDQTDRDRIQNGNTNTTENRIFEGIETLVPVATAHAHQFVVLPGSDSETSVMRAENLQKVLARKYETLEVQNKLEQITRHFLLYRFGVAKWEWSYEKDDVDVRVVDPRLILIPRLRMDPHDLPYKIEIQEYTKAEMKEFFPKAKLEDYSMETLIDTGGSLNQAPERKCYRVYETWTSEMVAYFCSKKLVHKEPNPYWDFKGREKKYIRRTKRGAKIAKQIVYDNIFDRPTDPFVFFTSYVVGDEPVGSVSLTDVAIPIQDAINTQKRRIIDNLRRMGNGQVYVDSDAMSQEEAENITDEVGLIIRGDGVASQNKVRREPGTAIPAAHFSNLTHSEAVLDNLMGIHAATRGAGASKTLGQDLLSRQQDFTRIDLITRVLNRGVARLAMGLVQLMKMFYTETQVTKILGEQGALEFVRLNRDDIEEHIEIIVKGGDNLPMDKISLRTEAVQLWQLGALDPVTLFSRLEFPDPEKTAERLAAWKQGQLTAETQAKIAQVQAAAQAKTSVEGGTPGGTPATETGPSGREIETPMNVMQRAAAGMGGTANLTATPNM